MKLILLTLIGLSLIGPLFEPTSPTQPIANASSLAPDQLPAEVHRDLARARSATARYHNVETAEADGYVNLNFCEEGEGCHWLKPSLLDAEFDPANPEILLYVRDGERWRFVAVEYVVPLSLSPGIAPAGFQGDADHWREDSEGVGLWELTVWLWLDNPTGLFEQHNPRLQ
jgi:hypothetical protein